MKEILARVEILNGEMVALVVVCGIKERMCTDLMVCFICAGVVLVSVSSGHMYCLYFVHSARGGMLTGALFLREAFPV